MHHALNPTNANSALTSARLPALSLLPPAINIVPASARAAADHVRHIHGVTPLFFAEDFQSRGITIRLWIKCEQVQSVNTFKARGAEWLIHNLARQFYEQRGRFRNLPMDSKPLFVTASAGNHAQGVALAAKRHDFEAHIFMPSSAPAVKQERAQLLGAKLHLIEGNFDVSLEAAKGFCLSNKKQRIFVPPYEHPDIIAGQASIAVEILSQLIPFHENYLRIAREFRPMLDQLQTLPDLVVCPVGGGGLASGIGAVIHEFNAVAKTRIKVLGVQSTAADSMYRSFKCGAVLPSSDPQATTLADGIAVKQAAARMVSTVSKYVDDLVLVPENLIEDGVRALARHPLLDGKHWRTNEFSKHVPYRQLPEGARQVSEVRQLNRIEGAAAAALAAIKFGTVAGELNWSRLVPGKKTLNVVCVLSGGNITLDRWQELTR